MPLLMPGNILNNILKGKLGVASVWGTDPANLENMTDGDIDTVTGTGEKVMGAAGFYGYIAFDLGSIKTVLLGARVGMWCTTGSVYVYAQSSNNNINWKSAGVTLAAITSVGEYIADIQGHVLNGRYIRLAFSVSTASTAYAKIYEVMGWELKV